MTDGTSQGLFIVVAIVIFGIFVVMAYILFEDTLSPAMASMFNTAIEQATLDLEYGEQFDYEALVPDKHLQRAIRDTLGLGKDVEITLEHLESESFTDLSANVSSSLKTHANYKYKRGEINIKSLEGLQHAKNLVSISLHGNAVESLEPIANLTKLTSFNVNMNRTITDLTPLENLTNMKYLMIEENPYTDLTPLRNMDKLVMLNIGSSNVTNVETLTQLPQIQELYIPHLKLESSDFLHGFNNLKRLDIRNVPFNDDLTIPSTVRWLRDTDKVWKTLY